MLLDCATLNCDYVKVYKNGELKSEYGIALTVSHNRNGSCISLGRLEQKV